MKARIEYEETPYYTAIQLPDKGKWIAYFKILYNEKEIQQDSFTSENRNEILKSVGLKGDSVQICLNLLDQNWNNLICGFFRHYQSMVFTELCMAHHAYSELIDLMLRPAKDQKERALKIDGLDEFKKVRQHIASLQKELTNGKNTDLGNVIAGTVLFKNTIVEANANKRSHRKASHRELSEEEYD